MTDAYLRATKTRRSEILGKGVFEVFPDNPDDPTTKAVDHARTSFQRVLEHAAKMSWGSGSTISADPNPKAGDSRRGFGPWSISRSSELEGR